MKLSNQRSYEETKNTAIEGICEELRQDLREYRAKYPKKSSKNKKFQVSLRSRMRELSRYLREGSKPEESYPMLKDWWVSYTNCDRPASETEIATNVLLEMADIEYDHKNYEKEADLCRQAKKLRRDIGIGLLLEARAEIALGHRKAARLLLEKYMSDDLHFLDRSRQNWSSLLSNSD